MKSVPTIVFAATILCFGILTIIEAFDDQKELNYGDKCETTWLHGRDHQVCNRTSNLKCNSETSKCDCDWNCNYNKDLGKCVGGIYGRCTPSTHNSCIPGLTCLVDPFFESERIPPSLMNTITKLETLHPQSETLSKPDYICRCPTGYEYFRGAQNETECRPFLNLGDVCPKNSTSSDSSCNFEKELICGPEGTCTCDKPMSYNKELQRCATPLGANCTPYDQFCGKHAICSTHLSHILNELLRLNLISKTSFDREKLNRKAECICAPGFKANAAGECVGGYQVPCDKSSDCDSNLFLSCVNGACNCKMPSGMTYFQAEAECKVHVGYPCTEKEAPRCVKNSVCKKNQCKCKNGFTEAEDGRCLLGQGSKCSMSYSFNGTDSVCNHFQGLACVDSKCECFDPMFKWNSTTDMCGAKTGNRCGEIRIIPSPVLLRDDVYPFSASGVTHFYIGCEDGSVCAAGKVGKYCHKVK